MYCDYKRLSEDTEHDLGATFAELDEVVSSADIVTVHVPLSDKTCVLALGAYWLQHCFPAVKLRTRWKGTSRKWQCSTNVPQACHSSPQLQNQC